MTWSSPVTIDGSNKITTIDCPSASLCVAGDDSGNVITSTDPTGGSTKWTATNLGGSFTFINRVSCPTVTLCVLADSAGSIWWADDPANGPWTETAIGTSIDSLACPSESLCVAGQGSNGTLYSTTTPQSAVPGAWQPAIIDGLNGEFSMACPTTTLCIAGNDVSGLNWSATPDGGVPAWTAIPAVGDGVTHDMACVTETFCVGVTDNTDVLTSTSPKTSAWTVTHLPPGFGGAMFGISCPATTLCVTSDGNNVYSSTTPMANTPSAWDLQVLASGIDDFSCTSAALCFAVGTGGALYIGTQATLNVTTAGAGTGSVTGNGIACPGTCSSIYPLNTAVTLTATPGSDGSTFAGWSGDCSGTGACNTTMAADRAVTATFDPAPPPVATPAAPPEPPTPPADLPPPVRSQSANAYPTSGKVLVRVAGTKTFVPLTSPRQVRFGSVFDTRTGVVQITISNGRGGVDSARFSEGQFRLVAAGGVAELDLVGGSFKGCPKAAKGGAAIAAAKKGRNVRHLWGEGTGSFRTKGRFASATIRGTRWLTDDYCRGTLVKVTVGAVTVRDLVLRKSRAVKAPKTYFAGPRAG